MNPLKGEEMDEKVIERTKRKWHKLWRDFRIAQARERVAWDIYQLAISERDYKNPPKARKI